MKNNSLRISLLICLTIIQTIFLSAQVLKEVYEWGTFTTVRNSAGLRLAGLKGEELPAFVYDLQLNAANNISLKNVEVQMETPVLYFYADQQMDAIVDVQFKNGIINQWYPDRVSGQSFAAGNTIDLQLTSTGHSKWNIRILDPAITPKLIDDYNIVTREYVSPRYTASNHIRVGADEYEKFIFYRGLGNFDTPVNIEFNDKDNLVMHNQYSEGLSYVMVYDNSVDRQPTIWWSGSMKAGEKKVIANPIEDTGFSEVISEMSRFEKELIKAGLLSDQAQAMLNTWFEGYFIDIADVKGLRVFWITPESYVYEVLPLTINPAPLYTKRVFVGRSEILKKDFEEELKSLTADEIDAKYQDHHYVGVFKDALLKGLPTQWTDYNDNVLTSVSDKIKSPLALKIMPNPFTESIIMQYRSEAISTINFSIIDMNGALIKSWNESPNEKSFKRNYSLKDLKPGSYILQSQQEQSKHAVKFVKQ